MVADLGVDMAEGGGAEHWQRRLKTRAGSQNNARHARYWFYKKDSLHPIFIRITPRAFSSLQWLRVLAAPRRSAGLQQARWKGERAPPLQPRGGAMLKPRSCILSWWQNSKIGKSQMPLTGQVCVGVDAFHLGARQQAGALGAGGSAPNIE